MEEDASHIFKLTETLSFPRLSGGEGEKKAREVIIGFCNERKINVSTHQFSASLFLINILFRLILSAWIVIIAFSLILIEKFGLLFALVSSLTALTMVIMARWYPCYDRFFDITCFGKIESANILASIKPDKKKESAKNDNSRIKNLVFMAHYDSKSQIFPIYLRAFVVVFGMLSVIVLAVISIARMLFPPEYGDLLLLSAYGCGIVSEMAFLFMFFNRIVDNSPGAMDNATGVSVLLSVIDYLSNHPEKAGIDIYFLFTGAEEIGLAGASRFLRDHKKDFSINDTLVVNLDGVGGDEKLLIVDHYGFPPVRTSKILGPLIRKIAANRKIFLHRLPVIAGALWDHVVWSSFGYDSVTLSIGGFDKATMSVHSREDVISNINPSSLMKARDICVDIVDFFP